MLLPVSMENVTEFILDKKIGSELKEIILGRVDEVQLPSLKGLGIIPANEMGYIMGDLYHEFLHEIKTNPRQRKIRAAALKNFMTKFS